MPKSNKYKWIFLFLGLIVLFLILLVVFVRLPLSKPKDYSVVQFSATKSQTISLPARLVGKGIPNAKITFSITPGSYQVDIKKNKADGQWDYVLPSIKPGKYRVTLELFDSREKLSMIKSYPIEIRESSLLDKIYQLLYKKASAQESLTEVEQSWVIQNRGLGIWPVKENGEFILYSEEEYDNRYCPYPCAKLQRPASIGRQIQNAGGANLNITQELIKKLQTKGYAPLPVLIPYIPELENEEYQRKFGITRAFAVNAKREISEADLQEILNEVISQQLDYQLKGGDVRSLIELAGIGTVVDVLSGEKKLQYVNNDEAVNLLLGLLILYEPVNGVATLGKGVVKMTPEIIEDIPVILRLIRSGSPVPTKVIKARVAFRGSAKDTYDEIVSRSSGWAKDFDNLPEAPVYGLKGLKGVDLTYVKPDNPVSQFYFKLIVEPGLQSQQVSQISTSHVLHPASSKVVDAVRGFYQRKGFNFQISPDYYALVTNGKAFVVDDAFFAAKELEYISQGRIGSSVLRGRSALGDGFKIGDLIVVKRSLYESSDGLVGLYHELIHGISLEKTFVYGADDDLSKALSMIYELSTDLWVNPIFGAPVNSVTPLYAGRGYAATNPEVAYAILHRMMKGYEKVGVDISDALLDFAIRGNSADLIKTLTGKTGKVGEDALLKTLDSFAIRYKNVVFAEKSLLLGGIIALEGATGVGIVTHADEISAGINQVKLRLTPAVDVSDDVLSNDYDPSLPFEPFGDVIITNVEGNFYPGERLQTSGIVSEFGEVDSNPDEYIKEWTIEPVPAHTGRGLIPVKSIYAQENEVKSIDEIQVLKGGEDCFDNCSLVLPNNIQPGKYNLVLYLLDKESRRVVDSDSFPITIKKAPRQIESFTINNQAYSREDIKNGFNLLLSADGTKPQLLNFPVAVKFTDGSSKYLVLNINFNPKQSQSLPDPTLNEDCHEEARDLGQGVARNYKVCLDGSQQPSGEEYCLNGSEDAECRLNQKKEDPQNCDGDYAYWDDADQKCIYKRITQTQPACDYQYEEIDNSGCGH